MTARVVVSSRARADIDASLDDLAAKAGVRVASDYVAALKTIYLQLASFPESGAPRSLLGRNTRMTPLLPYVVIYRYTAKSGVVEIIRILHGSRRISRGLLKAK